MSDEFLDIYDDNFNHIGVTSRKNAHKEGHWHYTFHCWVLLLSNDKPFVLFQRRNMKKDTNPGKLSVSAAGHILAGETVLDGLREVKEELGVSVRPEEVQSMGEYKIVIKNSYMYNREVSLMYYTIQDKTLDAFHPQSSEVSGLYLISVEDFFHLLHDDIPYTYGVGFEVDGEGNKTSNSQMFTIDDIAKDGIPYYRYVSSFLYHLLNLDDKNK